MERKAKKVYRAILHDTETHQLTEFVVKRCQAQHPDAWYLAAVTQLAHILRKGEKMDIGTARVLVSEFTVDPLIVTNIERKYDWSLIPD